MINAPANVLSFITSLNKIYPKKEEKTNSTYRKSTKEEAFVAGNALNKQTCVKLALIPKQNSKNSSPKVGSFHTYKARIKPTNIVPNAK